MKTRRKNFATSKRCSSARRCDQQVSVCGGVRRKSRPWRLLAATLGVASLHCIPNPAHAQNTATLLVITDATQPDSVPPRSRLAMRLTRSIETELQALGYTVLDPDLVFFDLDLPPGHELTPADVIARLPEFEPAPIDGVLAFNLFGSVGPQKEDQRRPISMRLPVRVHSVDGAEELAAFTLVYPYGELPQLPEACDRDCVLGHFGDQMQRLASDVGETLPAHLERGTLTQIEVSP